MYLGQDALQGPPGIELPAIISRFSNETHYVQKTKILIHYKRWKTDLSTTTSRAIVSPYKNACKQRWLQYCFEVNKYEKRKKFKIQTYDKNIQIRTSTNIVRLQLQPLSTPITRFPFGTKVLQHNPFISKELKPINDWNKSNISLWVTQVLTWQNAQYIYLNQIQMHTNDIVSLNLFSSRLHTSRIRELN